MFTDKVTFALIAAAKANGIDPAALCALVEVETGGKLFEQDGRTPQFLYERHVAFREAKAVSRTCLAAFQRAGLAIPKWDRATQYRDQRTSAQRLELIARARSIDEEVALRSASWGLGQTMGNLAQALGFASARSMVAHQRTPAGQIDCMIRELKRSHLTAPMNCGDWRHVARLYNGPGYAANRYHERLADAYKRWRRRLDTIAPDGRPREAPPEQSLSSDEVRDVQRRLRDLGYAEVGAPDGLWGSRTTGALSAFQAHEGLPVTGPYDPPTREALDAATARPVSRERAEADATVLKEAGSRTLAQAQQLSTWGKLLKWLGLGGAGAAGADNTGALEQIKGSAAQIGELRDLFATLSDLAVWCVAHWWIFALVAGIAIAINAEKIIAARVEDHRTGVHA
jgi:hypothetical protein